MKTKGTVVHLTMENGGDGIIDPTGRKFFPLNMPNQLKRDGAAVTFCYRPAEVVTSMMWGEPVYIDCFETI